MNIYKMSCDVDYYERVFNARKQNIYAYKSNIPEISKEAGRDCSHLDFSPGLNELLEDVVFFCETDNSLQSYNYLNNVHGWPIVHERVKDLLTEEHIRGVLFFPLRIIHDKSGLPEHGFYLLYTSNFIEAYDIVGYYGDQEYLSDYGYGFGNSVVGGLLSSFIPFSYSSLPLSFVIATIPDLFIGPNRLFK